MGSDLSDLHTFVGLITFEGGADILGVLSEEAEGAVGWMGGKAQNPDQFVELIRVELNQIGLELVEVEEIQLVESTTDVFDIDEHLAGNMQVWEPGKMTVWGTIHRYLEDGEA